MNFKAMLFLFIRQIIQYLSIAGLGFFGKNVFLPNFRFKPVQIG